MRPGSDIYYCYQWCGRMRWVCVRDANGRDCSWVLAHSLGRIVPGRYGSWERYQHWRDGRRTPDTEEKGGRKSQKICMWRKGGCFAKSQQKLSLPQLPIFPHSSSFAPSDIILPFCGFGDCYSRSREWAGAWMGTAGILAFYRRRLPDVAHKESNQNTDASEFCYCGF
jgi:hypothetical protein